MPIIRPLRGLQYGADHRPLLGELITPATVGEPTDRREVGDVHEFNIRRLVRGDFGELASDDEPRFSHAARLLRCWKEQGVLIRDPRPALYAYEQESQGVSRRGLLSLVRLSPYEDGLIRPHEKTRGGSTEALLAQLQATTTQLSMTMAMVPDENGALSDFLESFEPGYTRQETADGNGVINRVWRQEDPAVHVALAESLREQCAVIADGHHRYEAALQYQHWRRETEPRPARRREHPVDYILMLLVPASSQGLLCQPTHRVCGHLNRGAEDLLANLKKDFELADVGSDEELFGFLAEPGGIRFAMVRPGRRTTMTLREGMEASLAGLPEALRGVDAAIIEELLLGPMEQALTNCSDSIADTSVSGARFNHNRSSGREIVAQVLAGEADLAILLRPPPPSQVLQVAMAGELMPPKSTNFHPKPAKGLLMHSLHSF